MWLRRTLWIAALAGLLYVLWSIWDRDAVMAWVQQAQPLALFTAMALLPALGVPITPFFIVAGASFGVLLGLLGSGLALAANLAMCYWIARSGLQSRLESLLRRFKYDLPDFGEGGRDAIRFTLMVKFTPGVPAFVKNYGLAVAGVPFALYLGLSMFITGAYGAALVVLGESLFEHDAGRGLAAAAALAVLALGVWWWRRRRNKDEPREPNARSRFRDGLARESAAR
jgi:uncharacterized membrane protein YdjX (TVP38/TMEM64 family)